MPKPPPFSLEVLEKKHLESMLASERAILLRPDVYAQIRDTLRQVQMGPIDVSAYYTTACRLARLLADLNGYGGMTIFDYFCCHIDPAQQGDARYFRAVCTDLTEQLEELKQWRMRAHNMRQLK